MSIESEIVKKRFSFNKKMLAKASNKLLDLLYPPICVHCQTPVIKSDGLCAKCFSALHAITDPKCPILGLPFEVSLGANATSAEAIANPPEFNRARSAFIYDDVAHSIVTRLKYGDKPELAKFCAVTMAATCAEILQGDPILLPVPLHKKRLRMRYYNQSNEIAKFLANITGLENAPMLAKRIKQTKQQVGLNAYQRSKNVAGAFSVEEDLLRFDKEKTIVIIDDVITTGATVNELTKALKKAGYKKIDVISFARVVKEINYPI